MSRLPSMLRSDWVASAVYVMCPARPLSQNVTYPSQSSLSDFENQVETAGGRPGLCGYGFTCES